MGRVYRAIELRNNKKRIDVVGLVDTGADETVISEKIARLLKCGYTGEIDTETITLESVRINKTRISIFDRWSMNSTRLFVGVTDRFFDVDEGIEIILGIDFLQKTGLILDFTN